MHKSDRLFELIQILRDGRLHRAAEIAERLGVSVRTIWRDMTELMESGLPLEGERGVGYILRAPITMPPMILTAAELEALRLGIRLVADGADPAAAKAARALAAKLAAALPGTVTPDSDGLFDLAGAEATRAAPHLPVLRQAIRTRQRLTISYLDLDGRESHRDIRPLHLEFWGRVWTLVAWCEARGDFRPFRVDRIVALTETGETFRTEPGTGLEDYRARLTPAEPQTQSTDPAGS